MSFETVTATSRCVIELRDCPLKIKLFLLSDDPHDQERFARRQPKPLLGHSVFMPSAEDVVITKLRWSPQGQRHKDVDDVRNVLAVQGDNLDWTYLHRWCDRRGTRALLEDSAARSHRFDRVGGAGSVALNVLALGAHVACCGLLGKDSFGDRVEKALRAAGADVRGLVCADDRLNLRKNSTTGSIYQPSEGGISQVGWECPIDH
jgi:hypothetical protein